MSRQPSPTVWIYQKAHILGLPYEAVRELTFPQLRAALNRRQS